MEIPENAQEKLKDRLQLQEKLQSASPDDTFSVIIEFDKPMHQVQLKFNAQGMARPTSFIGSEAEHEGLVKGAGMVTERVSQQLETIGVSYTALESTHQILLPNASAQQLIDVLSLDFVKTASLNSPTRLCTEDSQMTP